MKADEIGAFEAKTRFAALLRDVEAGRSYTITRKGRPVARLAPLDTSSDVGAGEALRLIREARASYRVGTGELTAWRKAGRRA